MWNVASGDMIMVDKNQCLNVYIDPSKWTVFSLDPCDVFVVIKVPYDSMWITVWSRKGVGYVGKIHFHDRLMKRLCYR